LHPQQACGDDGLCPEYRLLAAVERKRIELEAKGTLLAAVLARIEERERQESEYAPRRRRGGGATCPECDQPFERSRMTQRYCSKPGTRHAYMRRKRLPRS